MMKKIGKLLCGVLLGSFALSGVLVSADTEKVTAATPALKQEEAIVMNMDTAERLASAKLTSTDAVYFDSVRLTTPAFAGGDSDWFNYTSLYFDLEKNDLSDVTKFTMDVRGVTSSTTWLRWFVIDENGLAMRLDATKATHTPYGKTAQTIGGSDWRGINVGGFTGMISATPGNFAVYTGAGGHYGTKTGTFDWTKVKYFMADMHTGDAKTVDVGNLYATTASGDITLFDMSTASAASSKAELSAGKYYFGSTPKYDDEYGVTELAKKGVTATYQTADKLAFAKASNTTEDACWISMFTENAPTQSARDLSAFNGMMFDVDMTGVDEAKTLKVDMILQVGGANYRGWGTATSGAVFFDENGNRSTDVVNQWKGGIKGTLVIPFDSFCKEGDTSDIVTAHSLTSVGLRCVPGGISNLEAGEKVLLSNMKFINYADDVVNANIGTEGGSIRLGEGTEEDPTGLRFAFTIDKSKYEALATKHGENFAMGILVIPTELLDGASLTQDNTDALNISVTNWLKESETTKTFTGVLLDVPNTNFETVCTARAYVKIGDSYYYSQAIERSIAQVATAAYNDTDGAYYENELLLPYMQNATVAE